MENAFGSSITRSGRRLIVTGSTVLVALLLTACSKPNKLADRDLAGHLIVTKSGGQVDPSWYDCDVFVDECDWSTEKERQDREDDLKEEIEKGEAPPEEIKRFKQELKTFHPIGSIKNLSEHILTEFGKKHAEEGVDNLLLFLNGGLNSSADAVKRARRQYKAILDEKGLLGIGQGAYPVFLAWPTPFVGSYWDNISRVRDSVRYNDTQWNWPVYLAGDVLETVARSPISFTASGKRYQETVWPDEGILKLAADRPLLAFDDDAETFKVTKDQNLVYDHSLFKSVKDESLRIQTADVERDFSREDFGYFMWTPVRLLGIPLVDTLGRTAWEQMLRRTQTMIRRDVEFNAELRTEYITHAEGADTGGDICTDENEMAPYQNPEDAGDPWTETGSRHITACRIAKHRTEFPAGSGAIARFFQIVDICRNVALGYHQEFGGLDQAALDEALTEAFPDIESPWKCKFIIDRPSDDDETGQTKLKIRNALREMKITLIGHSMGAIAANEILKAVPGLPWKDIVYMAAAGSIRSTNEAVSPVLKKNQGCTNFYNLMLHPLNDAREISFVNEEKYGLFKGIAPAGSLLAWIDTFYEQPKTIQDRTMGRWDNLRAARNVFPSDARRWMAWRVFNLDPEIRGPYQTNPGGKNGCPFKAPEPGSSTPLRHPMKHGDFTCLDQQWWTKRFWTGATGDRETMIEFEGDPGEASPLCTGIFSKPSGYYLSGE